MLDLIKVTQSGNSREGSIVVEPLPQGYGVTIGNSLRRVLLASLPGVAITQVKISGVKHEYSTLKGVKEDVVEILLNLKCVRLKLQGDKSAKLEIEAKTKISNPFLSGTLFLEKKWRLSKIPTTKAIKIMIG